jgi:hypothetical protein
LGMFLAGPLAFGSDLVYSLFKLETKISGWYYDNFRYLFMCLGPYLMACFIALGFYFYYSPVNHKNSWGGCLPLSIPIAKMMWMIGVTNDVEWHQVPPATYFGGAALIVITFWFVGDDLITVSEMQRPQWTISPTTERLYLLIRLLKCMLLLGIN